MSQEKVNQYKENKKNRKEIEKKAKQKSMIAKVVAGVIGAVLVVWLGYSAVVTIQNAEGPAVTVDSSAISEYVTNLE
jgi:cell division septal protein FtsQ